MLMLCVVPPCSSSGLNVCNVGASRALTAPGRAAPLSAARQSLITVGCHRWGFPFELLARPGQAVVFQLDLYLGNYTSKECTSIYGKHKISGMGNFLVEPTFLFAYWQVCTLWSKKNDLPRSIRLFSYPQLRSEDKKFVTDDNGWFPVIRTSRLP